ncbi:SLC13 family permease [Nocardioides aequoreus]|uniref:SLC13 family permease n=1 Tax=Nocardioides aequoreus TaxID=397278 RepID=UPI00056CB4C4|nr:SLC13 family permease [Nocardioides aequoreus]
MIDLLPLAERVWPVLLFLVLVQLVADLSDDAGLFDLAAHVAATLAGGRTVVLFGLFCALATVTTWLLSIDTTAVLLAPIGLTLARELRIPPLPFAFAAVWLASTASLLLPISNLTNLLAIERLSLHPHEFVQATWAPQLAVLAVVVAGLLARHRADLRGRYEVPGMLPAGDRVLAGVAGAVVVLLAPAVVLGVEPWLAAGVGVLVLVACFAVRRPALVAPHRLLGLVPWSVLALATVLFAVLGSLGPRLEPWLGDVLGRGDSAGDLATLAGAGVLLANGANNLPAYLLLEPVALAGAGGVDRLLTTLVAVNVGPLLLTWGALANLLWLRACRRRGVVVTARRFAREGLLVVPLAVAAGVAAVLWW